MKQTIPAIFLIVGTIIGAGFASGREISLFFAEFGWNSLYFLPIVFIFFYYTFKMFLNIGKTQKFENVFEVNRLSNSSVFFNAVVVIAFGLYGSAMFAGCVLVLSNNFIGIPSIVFSLVVLLISFVVLRCGFTGLVKVNFVLTPIIVLLLVFYAIYSIFDPITTIPYAPSSVGAHILPISILLYVFGNILLSYFILTETGLGKTKKQIKIIALVSALIICLALFVSIICLIVNGSVVMDANMPFLALTLRLGEPFPLLFMAILFLGIITSLFGCLHTVSSAFKKQLGKKTPYVVACAIFVASLVGFENIVNTFYPIFGLFGLMVVLKMIIYEHKADSKLPT